MNYFTLTCLKETTNQQKNNTCLSLCSFEGHKSTTWGQIRRLGFDGRCQKRSAAFVNMTSPCSREEAGGRPAHPAFYKDTWNRSLTTFLTHLRHEMHCGAFFPGSVASTVLFRDMRPIDALRAGGSVHARLQARTKKLAAAHRAFPHRLTDLWPSHFYKLPPLLWGNWNMLIGHLRRRRTVTQGEKIIPRCRSLAN